MSANASVSIIPALTGWRRWLGRYSLRRRIDGALPEPAVVAAVGANCAGHADLIDKTKSEDLCQQRQQHSKSN